MYVLAWSEQRKLLEMNIQNVFIPIKRFDVCCNFFFSLLMITISLYQWDEKCSSSSSLSLIWRFYLGLQSFWFISVRIFHVPCISICSRKKLISKQRSAVFFSRALIRTLTFCLSEHKVFCLWIDFNEKSIKPTVNCKSKTSECMTGYLERANLFFFFCFLLNFFAFS